jgi:very-short-patch-repair endonuclease
MVDLILGPRRRAQLGGCRVHRSRALAEGEVEVYRGVRVTAPVRTLVDLAPGLPVALLGRTVDEGLIQRIWTVEDLAVGAARSAGRPGSASLREIVRRRTGEGPAESHLEQRVIRTLKAFAPFETDYEVVVDGRVYRLDVAFPASLVAVECDGWAVRSRSRSKFDHDRRRNNSLLSHGWIVVHLTSAMSDDEMRGAVHAALLQAARNRAG